MINLVLVTEAIAYIGFFSFLLLDSSRFAPSKRVFTGGRAIFQLPLFDICLNSQYLKYVYNL